MRGLLITLAAAWLAAGAAQAAEVSVSLGVAGGQPDADAMAALHPAGEASGHVLARYATGKSAFTGRVDYLEMEDRPFRLAADPPKADRGEHGWMLTGAYRLQVHPKAQLWLEALHGSGKRPSLADAGLQPAQRRTLLQSSVRMSF